jgi:hypothetical protein
VKKILSIIAVIFFISTPAFANFNYGYDTYSQDGTTLILNSTGDQVTNSTFGNLGSNDFIAELAVKNELALAGYTVAYDYNPENTDGQFAQNYNVALPNGGAGLTKLTFAGFLGNPRATQDVYVLTSEYNALSSQGQANSIAGLQSATTVLNNSLNSVTNTVGNQGTLIAGNSASITNLNNAVAINTSDINVLNSNVNTINGNVNNLTTVVNNQGVEINGVANNVTALSNTVTVQGNAITQNANDIVAVNNYQSNWNQAQDKAIVANSNAINQVNSTQTSWNQTQDHEIGALQQTQQGQQNQINGLNNRVGALEKTQDEVTGKVRIFDTRKWQGNIFVTYSATRNTVASAGVEVTFKLGKSYEETQIDDLNKKIDLLMGKKAKVERQSNINIYHVQNGMGISEKF